MSPTGIIQPGHQPTEPVQRPVQSNIEGQASGQIPLDSYLR